MVSNTRILKIKRANKKRKAGAKRKAAKKELMIYINKWLNKEIK